MEVLRRAKTLWRGLSTIIFFIILQLFCSTGLPAAIFYVDSDKGDDGHTGTEETSPWKTLAKVTATTLRAGDKVLLARGGVWSGQLAIRNSGEPGNPIYIGAYGDDQKPKPIINGGGVVQAAVLIKNGTNHVTVEGLAVTNFDGKDIFDGAEGERAGIWAGEWGGAISDIKILHNEVYFIEGFSNSPMVGSPRGTTLDPKTHSQYSAGCILIHPMEFSGVTIDGNNVHDCTTTGIFSFPFTKSSGLLIQNNTVSNVGSDGIEILNSSRPIVQYNSCIHAGNNSGTRNRAPGELGFNGLAVGGMWATGSSDVLFQYNDCEGTRQIKYDGEAWDFDNHLSGVCIYQYNFSRDNDGGFLLSNNEERPGYKRICRFNISVNDGSKQGAGEGFFNSMADYYNNIFFRTDGKPYFLPDKAMGAPLKGIFKNNIFYTTSTSRDPYQTEARAFTNNCFYGFMPEEPGANAVLADPMFAEPEAAATAHSLKDLSGFRLKVGSPCNGAGIIVPDNGGKDFWGDVLTADKMNIGAE